MSTESENWKRVYPVEGVDDFGLVPTEDIASELELYPSPAKQKEGQLRDLLSAAKARPAVVARAKDIVVEARSKPIDVVAEHVGATPAEVKGVVDAAKDLSPRERRELAEFSEDVDSVFNLDIRIQELFDSVKKVLKHIDPDSEAGLGYHGELRQLLKLAKDYMKDAKFIENLRKDHEEEMNMVLEELETLAPDTAARLFKRLEERRKQKRIIKGR